MYCSWVTVFTKMRLHTERQTDWLHHDGIILCKPRNVPWLLDDKTTEFVHKQNKNRIRIIHKKVPEPTKECKGNVGRRKMKNCPWSFCHPSRTFQPQLCSETTASWQRHSSVSSYQQTPRLHTAWLLGQHVVVDHKPPGTTTDEAFMKTF